MSQSVWQRISIIIPVYNEADTIEDFLKKLQEFRQYGHEVVLVDGHSQDKTQELARPYVDRLISSAKGRARQMDLGAKMATGQVFLFLHADTQLPDSADLLILNSLARGKYWGRFNIRLSGTNLLFRIIEKMMNWRSCLTGIATGDQAIYMSKMLYHDIGGFPQIELMEDIELCTRLIKWTKPDCLKQSVISSSRRWEKNGILHTVLFMWMMRLQYFFGVSAKQLQKKYYPEHG
ncbi:MAG: TIGR04283 family arsenosugar biosynthesis glycosyltransferase [gamma proteobacterium symbiont of Taylorina sp.]|nr:TIGR04283 family arsenosugar biosynthesis glycosyltransferase [gamma proteobacterium symbiont of Taylorina sp.]